MNGHGRSLTKIGRRMTTEPSSARSRRSWPERGDHWPERGDHWPERDDHWPERDDHCQKQAIGSTLVVGRERSAPAERFLVLMIRLSFADDRKQGRCIATASTQFLGVLTLKPLTPSRGGKSSAVRRFMLGVRGAAACRAAGAASGPVLLWLGDECGTCLPATISTN